MLHINEQDVLRLLPMREAIRLVRDSFARLGLGTATNQPRRRLTVPSGAVLHQLAGAFGPYFGCKIYATHVKHGAHFFVLLFDAATAKPLALFDANHLGQIRTGAASGVATDLMARAESSVLGVIGSGFQARTQIEAMLNVRPIRQTRVWSRDAGRRTKFAAECSAAFGAEIVPAASAEEAVRGADILVTATFAKDPVLESNWVAPGVHINAIGSNNPTRREIPAELVGKAARVAVDSIEQARVESGDLLLAWDDEDWSADHVVELQEIAAGRRPGRIYPDEITLFKSNGLGVQDIAVAGYVYEQASQ